VRAGARKGEVKRNIREGGGEIGQRLGVAGGWVAGGTGLAGGGATESRR